MNNLDTENTDVRSDAAGQHVLIDIWGSKKLTCQQTIEACLTDAAKAASATILQTNLHTFEGGGITGVILLAESHMSIHTWPERDYAAIDVFVCGACDAERAVAVILEHMKPESKSVQFHERGRVVPEQQSPKLASTRAQ